MLKPSKKPDKIACGQLWGHVNEAENKIDSLFLIVRNDYSEGGYRGIFIDEGNYHLLITNYAVKENDTETRLLSQHVYLGTLGRDWTESLLRGINDD